MTFNKINNQRVDWELKFIFFLGLLLILLAAFKTPGVDADSMTYIGDVFTPVSQMSLLNKEPMFWFIVLINQWVFSASYTGFFFIYALLGVGVKIYAINEILPNRVFFPFLVYCFIFYLVHEFTQIRGGVAIGLFLLSLKYVYHNNPQKFFFINAIAIMFHYSALIALPVYFMSGKKINVKFYSLLPFLGILFAIFLHFLDLADKASLIKYFSDHLPSQIGFKLSLYASLLTENTQSEINLFNFFYLSIICFYYFSLWNLNKISKHSEFIFISLKLTGVMIFCFYFFSFFPVMAYRLSEFYGISLVILLPSLAFAFRQVFIAKVFIFFWLLLYFIFGQFATLNL
ncbi:EpsG family protein [Aeromonas veronii]|uniref:EpsG family protein n=1 Tax=Aeromonas veronii TaxID=654 RepID=UPI003BA06235